MPKREAELSSRVIDINRAIPKTVVRGFRTMRAFFRNLFGLVAILPLALRAGIGNLKSRQPGLQIIRSGFGLVAMFTWFYALSVVPIAQATALSFSAVIFGSVGAAAPARA